MGGVGWGLVRLIRGLGDWGSGGLDIWCGNGALGNVLAGFGLILGVYSWNFVRTLSVLPFHSHSWSLARWIFLSIRRSFNVKRGPNSCNPTRKLSAPLISLPSAPCRTFSLAFLSRNT